MTERDWDAVSYDRVSDPQFKWALEQLERLDLASDDVVLDAGCGSGRVTEVLVERVPSGRVYAIDAAPSMVAHTQERLRGRVTALCQDLCELNLPEPLDVVFSNATFHWIADHDRLFARLYDALKPGGRLLAQCGGEGNIDAFRTLADRVATQAPFATHFRGWRRPWNYAGIPETTHRLQRAGFVEVEVWLEPKPVTLSRPREFAQTVCLVRHLDPLPPELRERFVEQVLEQATQPLVLEYVRLNLSAQRPI